VKKRVKQIGVIAVTRFISMSKKHTGKKFNNWKILSEPFKLKSPGPKKVKAECVCGKVKEVSLHHLKSGSSKSCGCINIKKLKNYVKKNGAYNKKSAKEKLPKILYNQYKFGAKKRGINFKLTLEEFEKFIYKECAYCGTISGNKRRVDNENLGWNGIDRFNNDIGYTKENCITCCGVCNKMKSNLDIHNFIEHIQKIIRNNNYKIKEKKLKYYMDRASIVSKNSPDLQTKVGAVLVNPKTGAVEAEGYNGFIRGAPDDKLPKTRPEKYKYMIHAEMNLIFNAIRSGVTTQDKILVVTLSPCIHCIRSAFQAGIETMYFKDEYRDFSKQLVMADLEIKLEKIDSFTKITLSPKGIL